MPTPRPATPARPKGSPAGSGKTSEAAVAKATGRGVDHWFAVLDRFDVKTNGHKAAAVHLHERHGVGEWWCQSLVVSYEQARGLRKKHESADGYKIGVSRVVNVPVAALFDAWADEKARARWLPDPGFTVRKATPAKSMRITWVDGKTSVECNFYAKGEGKSQVAVQHGKLASEAAAARMKKYWGGALDRLRAAMEG